MMTPGDVPPKAEHPQHTTGTMPESEIERFSYLLELLPDAVVVANAAGRLTLVNQQAEAIFGYSRAELLGQPIERLIPQRFRQAHRRHRADYAAAPITRSMGTALKVSARRKDGSEFPVEVRLSALPEIEHSEEFLVLATIRDISERRQVERERRQIERARREAETATEELRRVQAITDVALSHQTLDALLPAVLNQLCEALRVDRAAILLMDEDGQALTLRAACGLEEEMVAADARVPVGEGFAGRIAASRAPLVVDDLSTFPAVSPFLRERLRSALGVPLMADGQLLGVLHMDSVTPRRFSERDVRLLQLVAERIALAIDRAQLYDAAQAALAQARQQEARASRLVAANLIGVIVADGDRLIEANDAFLQMVGYSRADLEAGRLRWPEMTPPEYAPLHERALAELRERGVCTPFEKEYMRKDGSRVPILIRVARFEERPELYVSFVVDLSERILLEDTVAQTAAQLDAVFQAIGDGIMVFDMTGQVVLVNAAEARIIGYPSAEKMRRDLAYFAEVFELAHLDGRLLPVDEWPVSRALRGEAFADWELRVRRRDTGREWVIGYSGEPVRDAAGRQFLAVVVTRDITERERLTRAVTERAQQLEATMGAMVDAVVVYDAEGRITQMNAATRDLFTVDAVPGYAQRSLEERAAFFAPRDVAGLALPREAWPQTRLLRGEVLVGASAEDVLLRGLDGRDVLVSVTGAPLRDAAGAVTGAVLALRDVTAQRRLEREARALAAQLRTTFDTMADLVFVYDPAGRLLRMNAATRALLGLADEAAEAAYATRSAGERARPFTLRTADGQPLPPEAYPVARVLRGETLTAAAPQDVGMTDADGRERVLSFTGGPMRDAEGALLGYVTVGHDITARWRLEQRVGFQASLLEQTHDAIFVWELGGPIVFWNQGAELLYGYRADEALGRVTHDLLRTRLPEPAPAFEARLQREGEWLGEQTHTTRDGRVVNVLSRLQVLRAEGLPGAAPSDAVRDGAGNWPREARLFICETARDITALKQLERARAEAEAREVATRDVNQQLDEFFNTAAHEIRNPVSVVKMSVQMAQRRFEKLRAMVSDLATAGGAAPGAAAPGGAPAGDPKEDRAGSEALAATWEAVRASLRAAEADADRLARLTIQLFDVARARAGTLELNVAPCDLALLVREQVAAQRLATPERTIHLELPADRQTVMARVDADRLSQVLANYLTNALKYSAEDQPVTVALEATGELAVAQVRDYGPGLPEEERSKVWEPFHRAPGIQALSRLGKATGSLGLGLHICKHIVELHPGGEIGVESKEGEGSTFWFRLPLLREEDEVQRQA